MSDVHVFQDHDHACTLCICIQALVLLSSYGLADNKPATHKKESTTTNLIHACMCHSQVYRFRFWATQQHSTQCIHACIHALSANKYLQLIDHKKACKCNDYMLISMPHQSILTLLSDSHQGLLVLREVVYQKLCAEN